jgi:hypothetical protein
LALDINTTAYVSETSPSASQTILEQMSNYMRVCVETGEETVTMRGIASPEPILSGAASLVMRQNLNFDLACALSEFRAGSQSTYEIVENY